MRAAVTPESKDAYVHGLLLTEADVPAWLGQEHAATFEDLDMSLPASIAGACAWAGVELAPSLPEALLAYGDWCFACHVNNAETGALQLTGIGSSANWRFFIFGSVGNDMYW